MRRIEFDERRIEFNDSEGRIESDAAYWNE
jgi:hypothetical protein